MVLETVCELARLVSVCLACYLPVWFGLVWFGSARFGSVRFNSIQSDSIRLHFFSPLKCALPSLEHRLC